MSHHIHIRPDVAAFPDGSIHVFVGGYFSVLTIEAAEAMRAKLDDAIAKVRDAKKEST